MNVIRLVMVVAALGVAPAMAASAQSPLQRASLKLFEADGHATRTSEFSGKPVPRYSSLKYAEVNGRAGPGLDYPVAWTYARQGLPVVVVRESRDWRRVRDPQGDEVWVHQSQLAGERTVMAMENGFLRRRPGARDDIVATYSIGVVMMVEACEEAWCRVSADGRTGWAPRVELWGAAELSPGRSQGG